MAHCNFADACNLPEFVADRMTLESTCSPPSMPAVYHIRFLFATYFRMAGSASFDLSSGYIWAGWHSLNSRIRLWVPHLWTELSAISDRRSGGKSSG
jgi:hypothetical protein